MLVMDHGHTLDEPMLHCTTKEGPTTAEGGVGGAQHGLRWARKLQHAAMQLPTPVVCFGLMTGLHQQLSSAPAMPPFNAPTPMDSSAELGAHIWLHSLPMSRLQFWEMTKLLCEPLNRSRFATNNCVAIAAARYYPDARALWLC